MQAKLILVKRVDELIALADETISFAGNSRYSNLWARFKAQSLAFIISLNGTGHPNYSEFMHACRYAGLEDCKNSREILLGIKHDIQNDYYLSNLRGIVSAEIFSDFLEMAEHLLNEHFKDPAAVMIGSVLEEHLRFLCGNHSVPISFVNIKGDVAPKKADVMNADLTKAGVYNTLQQKNITAWLGLRNSAAHGKYSDYTEDQVKLMYTGVLNFATNLI